MTSFLRYSMNNYLPIYINNIQAFHNLVKTIVKQKYPGADPTLK